MKNKVTKLMKFQQITYSIWFFCCFVLLISCSKPAKETNLSEAIRLNQIGYYPNSIKQFVVANIKATSFKVVDENNKEVFKGNLINNGVWEASGEHLFSGDFSAVTQEGKWTIIVDDTLKSYSFEIKKGLYVPVLNAAIKSFYYQIASMDIKEQYGGIYKRKAGLLDDNCLFHPSSGRTTGSIDASGGWFDAGDYGKYTVNAALAVGQMLQLVEQYPTLIADQQLNIPESGNQQSDLMDELAYELNWILKMQDNDGGVFHKVTAQNFCGFIMPDTYNLQ